MSNVCVMTFLGLAGYLEFRGLVRERGAIGPRYVASERDRERERRRLIGFPLLLSGRRKSGARTA